MQTEDPRSRDFLLKKLGTKSVTGQGVVSGGREGGVKSSHDLINYLSG